MEPLTHEERQRIKSRISMTLCNLGGAFVLYWLPEKRRTAARSIASQRPWPVPPGAVKIGTYCAPMRSEAVLEDLEDALVPGVRGEGRAAPVPAPAPSVAAPRCDREAALAVRDPGPRPFNPFDPPDAPGARTRRWDARDARRSR
jgi:hypothetical protein